MGASASGTILFEPIDSRRSTMKTRKEFLEAVTKMANLRDLKQADAAAQAVVSLTKLLIGDELSNTIARSLVPDLRKGWDSVSVRSFVLMKDGLLPSITTRKEFLEAVMKMAYLKDLKEADTASRIVISLMKAVIGIEFSQQIAAISPPDLRGGWESIRAAQADDFERHEMLFETGEVVDE
jgi:uncharacterized protein (DUF2267 family)